MMKLVDEGGLAYGSNTFAQSLSTYSEIITLPFSKVNLIKRPINNTQFDLKGVYPFSMCTNWNEIYKDVEFMYSTGAISVVFVSDSFYENEVNEAIGDWTFCRKYKKHYIIDLLSNWQQSLKKETKRLSEKAIQAHNIQIVKPSEYWIKKFWHLYQNLVKRHKISKINQVTLPMLIEQLKTPGAFMSIAENNGELYSAMIFFLKEDKVYLYLQASADIAYKRNTNYGLYHETFRFLQEAGMRWMNLGGNAGDFDNTDDGLALFKKKWSNNERYSLLCGKIFQQSIYEELSGENINVNFFPAYRYRKN